MIFGPHFRRNPKGLPYGMDNGRFIACCAANGKAAKPLPGTSWDSHRFQLLLDFATRQDYAPLWVVVPDIVGDADGTFQEWSIWAPWIKDNYGFPLALAVQDGMEPAHLPTIDPAPDTIFIGGTYWWKRNGVKAWCKAFPRVHVGRVNSYDFLCECEDAGADSADGTGWFRAGPARLQPLLNWLSR